VAEVEIIDRWAAIRTPLYLHVKNHTLPKFQVVLYPRCALKIKQLPNAAWIVSRAMGKDRQPLPRALGNPCRVCREEDVHTSCAATKGKRPVRSLAVCLLLINMGISISV
jgi:hypothetical protein